MLYFAVMLISKMQYKVVPEDKIKDCPGDCKILKEFNFKHEAENYVEHLMHVHSRRRG